MTFGKFVAREIKAKDIQKAIENAGNHQRLFIYTETIEDIVFKTSDNHVVHTAKNFWPATTSSDETFLDGYPPCLSIPKYLNDVKTRWNGVYQDIVWSSGSEPSTITCDINKKI